MWPKRWPFLILIFEVTGLAVNIWSIFIYIHSIWSVLTCFGHFLSLKEV
jgi:hypothetical protein